MSSKTTNAPQILLDLSITNKKIKKNKSKKRQNQENKENIQLNIIKEVNEEDNSSSKYLKKKENAKKPKKEESKLKKDNIISIPVKINELSNNNYEKYAQRMKEKTMRMEIDRIYNETERLNQQFEERKSNLHFFNNNPQFKKIVKSIEVQLFYYLMIEILFIINSTIIYFTLVEDNNGIGLASLCLSISLIAMTIILITSLKIGILNDPDLSKAFRFFFVLEFLILISSFCINIISGFIFIYNTESIYLMELVSKYKIIIYLLFAVVSFAFIVRIKIALNLFFESALILIGKKTEYSVSIIREEKSNKDNIYYNLSTSNSNEGLNNTTLNLFSEKNKNKETKDEIDYMTYNYFNKFHYSVSSDRKREQMFNQSNNFKFI